MEKTPKILIVDDTPLMAKLTQKAVQSFGYDTEIRKNSTRAVAYVGNNDVDVILMDIELANSLYDGIETSKVIKSKYSIPIIFLTGHENAAIFKEAGLDCNFDVLIKPFDNKMLKMHIDIAIQNSSVEREYRTSEMVLDNIIEKSPNPIFIVYRDGVIFKLNSKTEAFTDYSHGVMLQKNILKVLALTFENAKEDYTFSDVFDAYKSGKQIFSNDNGKLSPLNISIEKYERGRAFGAYFIEILQ